MRALLACLLIAVVWPAPAAAQRITGTATKRDRMALPPEAVFEATVEDVSRADAPATTVGAVRIEGPGQVPIAFSIDVDPRRVEASHTYAVRASLFIGGQMRYTTDTRHPVLTQGAATRVEILLVPVPAQGLSGSGGAAVPAGNPSPALEGTYWKLTQLAGQPVVPAGGARREANLRLGPDRRASLTGGCNQMTAGYELEGARVAFGKVAGTLMACPPGEDVDSALTDALSRVTRWTIQGQALELSDVQGLVLARFEAATPPPAAGGGQPR